MIFNNNALFLALGRRAAMLHPASAVAVQQFHTARSLATPALAATRTTDRRSDLPPSSIHYTSTYLPMNKFQSNAAFSTAPKKVSNLSQPDMFCRQCEQTQDGFGCSTVGVCGKTAETSSLQDVLVHVAQSVALWSQAARASGANAQDMHSANVWTLQGLFSTLTNVNFSSERIAEYIREGQAVQQSLRSLVANLGGSPPSFNIPASNLEDLPTSTDDLESFGLTVSIPARQAAMDDEDRFSLVEIATYGIKGACAYAAHCHQLGHLEEPILKDIHEVLANVAKATVDPDVDLLANTLKVGEINARVLALLDEAHAAKFGNPEPTEVRTTAVEGKAILISGHDMADLDALLQQTAGTGVNVYTHGEMLPAHSYPKLKNTYPHLVGNYGTAWQNQKFEFAGFPGPIIVTTNCIVQPRRAYKNRIYTMNEVGVDGVTHIGPDRDFSAVIEQAQELKGFPRTIEPARYHTVGFNHRAVLPLAGEIISAAKSGALSRIFLIGGCDGSQWDRNYFTDLAEALPEDSLILTLGCAKNRFIHSEKLEGKTLANGLPRIIDMGQCNDSYSAVVVALELAKALECGVNDLPLSLCLSHLEQKAAAVLLTLLHLGVKNIRLGPSLPAYVTPNVLALLSKEYNLMPTGDVETDIKHMMQGR